LPGYGAEPEDIISRGFLTELQDNVHADTTVVDAHLGYYVEKNILVRLEQDVIGPARALGYEKVWVVAISMGALGALGYGATHAHELDGVVLLAPWMGLGFRPGGVEREIASSGGLAQWRDDLVDDSHLDGAAPMRPDGTEEEFFRLIWGWAARAERPDGTRVPIYVGYGRQDRWARTQSLLAEAYPERQRLVAGGLHDWDVFFDVWRGFLWQGFMQRSCGRSTH
jgi:pimeloyl-ACP methyl ester carboxylesterase